MIAVLTYIAILTGAILFTIVEFGREWSARCKICGARFLCDGLTMFIWTLLKHTKRKCEQGIP